ncbi:MULTISPECIES: adenylyltransferase/cytidyltransferase family protein [Pseudomonas]|uniref:adenylyltransferase/cytidyltransferase family protein n=1 Tax=Pseudomonas TaxID=286 RepID=UPI0006904061|nr:MULTISPECIES: adenylyltransferase/cytidyltransferase family protein [Pseudomonas]MBH3432023.1 adenylyltransferase/cytidyltransferase family protein [Pseudomonas citronellolis]OHR98511.1 glycerol-3-phosphate cytidiltransferase [Pseudomonas sp. HMSC75E02]
MRRVVITYGTFDLFHNGHLKLLKRLRELGDSLVVGVSTDEFNKAKGKRTIIPFQDRFEIVSSIKHVDFAFAEKSWEQKESDIERYKATIFGMGHDWQGKFDHLKTKCEVIYLPRTEGVSSTEIKNALSALNKNHISEIKNSLDTISSIIESLG